jgi:tetratricopeptide (TPR) repeat protein
MENFQDAINDCTKAIAISPNDNAEPYYNRGLAYANIGEITKALEDYNKVIELAPENADAYAKRGLLNSQLDNKQNAISDFETFLRLDPNNPNASLVRNSLNELKRGSPSSGGGCYIATCVYGSYECQEVKTLRSFRDNSLSNYWLGRQFIRIYYATSPKIVKLFGKEKWFSRLWRPILDKLICKLQNNEV